VEAAEVSIYIMAPAAAGMILGGVILGQYFGTANKMKLIKIGLFCAAGILMLFSQVDRFGAWFGFPLLIALGFSNSLLEIPVNTLIQEHTPEAVRSRIYGVIATIIGVAAIIPVIGAGTVADIFGVRILMFGAGVALLFFGLFSLKQKWS
jgi:MFS family permease